MERQHQPGLVADQGRRVHQRVHVKYLKGASGSTDITAAVLAGTYKTTSLVPGQGVVIRLVVTIATSAQTGVTRNWLVAAASKLDSIAKDAVDAQLNT